MRVVAAAVLAVIVGAACGGTASAPQLSGPSMGDYPAHLALVDDPVVTGSAAAPAAEDAPPGGADMVATVEQVYGETDEDDSLFAIDFGAGADDLEACTAVLTVVVLPRPTTDEVGAAFEIIGRDFDNPVLDKLEAAMLGDTSAAADLFLDPDAVVDQLRLDATTFDACGAPLFAATIGDAAPAAAPGDCFRATALDNSAKVAVGAELNEDLFSFERVDCAG